MKSQVYFIKVGQTDDRGVVRSKLMRLLDQSKLLDCIHKKDDVAIKIHFGEEGNIGYVRPEYVRIVYDALTRKEATAFLADTNTLYRGRRMHSDDHRKLAYEHGFTLETAGARVLIPDDTQPENTTYIELNRCFIRVAKIAKAFCAADAIVGVAHFKGHMMSGFGGALKNIGMGCATREGKLEQHSDISPIVLLDKCVGCAACAQVCPIKAINIKDKKAQLDGSKCIGCASCIAACSHDAMDVDWEAGGDIIQEKMAEYALAALSGKENKAVFLNFALKITQECDCLAKADPRIAPDIGIFASFDPVSIDRASLDLVNAACGKDIFKTVHPRRDGFKQLRYAAGLGLGNLDYELVEVD